VIYSQKVDSRLPVGWGAAVAGGAVAAGATGASVAAASVGVAVAKKNSVVGDAVALMTVGFAVVGAVVRKRHTTQSSSQ
jgi:hypothetical protein